MTDQSDLRAMAEYHANPPRLDSAGILACAVLQSILMLYGVADNDSQRRDVAVRAIAAIIRQGPQVRSAATLDHILDAACDRAKRGNE